MIRDHGTWTNSWSTRLGQSGWWEAELSHELLRELEAFRQPHEDLSMTIVRIFALHDQNQHRKRATTCHKPQTS